MRIKSKPVGQIDKKILSLIKDLKDTLKVQTDPEGVGLAAPQIGKNLRIFLLKFAGDETIFINPEVITFFPAAANTKTDKKIMEGCLSLPNFYSPITRTSKLKVVYRDESGEQKTETFAEFTAQIIQHEIDHLNGILFIDRLFEQKKPLYELTDGEWEEVEL